MEDIYMLTDAAICNLLGEHLKGVRLQQNITQQRLADDAGVSLSTVKKMEKGEIGVFDAFLRVLRTLGRLDVLGPLVEELQLSPNEYYEMVQKAGAHRRKRAAGKHVGTRTRLDGINDGEDIVW